MIFHQRGFFHNLAVPNIPTDPAHLGYSSTLPKCASSQMGGFHEWGYPKRDRFHGKFEHKMDDLGVALF